MVASSIGHLIVGGFGGTTLPPSFGRALAEGRVGGAILFRRNLGSGPDALLELAELNASIVEAARRGGADRALAPIVAVDQEGGRVARVPAPALRVPPMRALGKRGDLALIERVARGQAEELRALGFTMSFAPVLDVDTNPANPVIGDRSFGADAESVARAGLAYARGLAAGGVHACGKHFPGHGDTSVDSHLALPTIDHARDRLDAVELLPFRAAARDGMDALMTAHLVCRALEPDATRPATLSYAIATTLLREELGFRGVLFSDDLEMRAISDGWGVEEAAVLAIAAGCDALLVCASEELQECAYAAMAREAAASAAFRARCDEALVRVHALRGRTPPAAISPRDVGRTERARSVAAELAELAELRSR